MSGPIVQSVDVSAIFQRLEMVAEKALEDTPVMTAGGLLSMIENEAQILKALYAKPLVPLSDVVTSVDALAVTALLQAIVIQAYAQSCSLKQTPTAGSVH